MKKVLSLSVSQYRIVPSFILNNSPYLYSFFQCVAVSSWHCIGFAEVLFGAFIYITKQGEYVCFPVVTREKNIFKHHW